MTRALRESRETPTAESFFLHKQMTLQTPIVVVLEDGERVEGVLEWYDRNSIKLRGRHEHARGDLQTRHQISLQDT